jgi:hypothetical protein
MTSAADLTLYDLIALESQLPELRRTQVLLHTVTGKGDVGAARMAVTAAAVAMNAVAMTVVDLRRRVAAHDDDGGPGSIGELVLRAQRWVILHQLGVAAQVLHAAEPAAKRVLDRQLFRGRLGSIGDVIAYVRSVFERASAAWRPFCAQDHNDEPRVDRDARRALHRHAVRVAATLIAAIATDPDVAFLLRAGASVLAPPTLRAACTAVRVALEISLELEPDIAPGGAPTVATQISDAWGRR